MDRHHSEELLKYMVENNIIDLPTIEQKVQMNKKEKLIAAMHRSPITKGKDGRWRTRIEVENGTQQVAKTKRDDLLDFLYQFYLGIEEEKQQTFKKMFKKFRDYKEKIVDENTIYKYDYDYKRFFEDTEFEGMEISEISEEDCSVFIVSRIRTLRLRKKAYESMYGYMKGTLKYARNKHFIDENPMDFLERKDFYRHCFNQSVNANRRVVSDIEMKQISDKISTDHQERPNYIPNYAVELAKLTGMRVGELAALMWDCIDFDKRTITIDKAEKFSQKSKVYSIGKVKNDRMRVIPMTAEIEKLLKTIRDVENEYGYLCEFVFANEDGRIHKVAIGHCATNTSIRAGVGSSKSIHSYRRTLNSKMKMNGASTTTTAAMLGHTEIVNERNYTYDVADMEYKRSILEKASQ